MGENKGAGSGPDRHVRRRALLVGGAAAVAGGVALGHDALSRLWWKLPGAQRPRVAGAVDFGGARWVAASPANYREADRPDDYPIDRVVVHVTQGGFASAVKAFQDPGHRAAAHYIVRRDGRITQMIRELDVAFHAGNRAYNERSVGIEHEGYVDDASSFTDAMYAASARLTAQICRRYGMPVDREHIIGHVEVPGTDHTDPGPHWDWARYLRLVRAAPPDSPTPSPSGAGTASGARSGTPSGPGRAAGAGEAAG
ncbi:N-acetylmuramoyl-L-alanine amidase [Streptomyces sennicomposti]|uniref:N-acetylmuramoyl-L-alanine amidase n=1 Tax=Streptomyces sennicomposti TaxID=2873384 RepID=UPI001CA73D85|nr:peptidoglycan recognition family protein [Streptomyces sennicomposti]MBY8869364.1 N-acetylmuramoyl-L-alanine amidase [Streptomyces sennicomposti]